MKTLLKMALAGLVVAITTYAVFNYFMATELMWFGHAGPMGFCEGDPVPAEYSRPALISFIVLASLTFLSAIFSSTEGGSLHIVLMSACVIAACVVSYDESVRTFMKYLGDDPAGTIGAAKVTIIIMRAVICLIFFKLSSKMIGLSPFVYVLASMLLFTLLGMGAILIISFGIIGIGLAVGIPVMILVFVVAVKA